VAATYFGLVTSLLISALVVLGPSTQPVATIAVLYAACGCLSLVGLVALSPGDSRARIRFRIPEFVFVCLACSGGALLVAVIGTELDRVIRALALIVVWGALAVASHRWAGRMSARDKLGRTGV
jgi:hypothetical protein